MFTHPFHMTMQKSLPEAILERSLGKIFDVEHSVFCKVRRLDIKREKSSLLFPLIPLRIVTPPTIYLSVVNRLFNSFKLVCFLRMKWDTHA